MEQKLLIGSSEELSESSSSSGDDETPLGSISFTGGWDIEQATKLSTEVPDTICACIHELVESQATHQPDAIAIQAWDGTLTYSELNSAANRLAHHLIEVARVQVGDLVHVCFEKSVWFFVAMLAINKAGAAWVPLEPTHPMKRQQQIVRQTRARLALASPTNAEKCAMLVENVVEVTATLDENLKTEIGSSLPPTCGVTPYHAGYVLFTSGSTGTPKGLVMEHRAVCTSQVAISKRLGLTPRVRILQFSTFTFDLCIGEIIASLISGATLCIPSEEACSSRLKEFINDNHINWAFLTPSIASTLKPEDIPGLELLLLAGEVASRGLFETWVGKVRLINGWGPAETCVFSTLHEWKSAKESPLTIGRPVGCFCWIVNPQNPKRLAPAGTVGEAVIQGPTLLREYLEDPTCTKATVMRTLPLWAPRRTLPHWNRFFKSGDLCLQNLDGTIEFVGRKDTQVKIQGFRVEPGEVEHHLLQMLAGVRQVVVDVFEGDTAPSLVAYFCLDDDTHMLEAGVDPDAESVLFPPTPDIQTRIMTAIDQLSMTLPDYMVPTMFLPCRFMPLNTSKKIDRGGLGRMTAALGQRALAKYALLNSDKSTPEATIEADSHEMKPFATWPSDKVTEVKSNIRKDCELCSEEDIEDAYACTSVQEGLMALAVKQPGSYLARHVYRLPRSVETTRFKDAWHRTVKHCTNLRTRIVAGESACIQAIINEKPSWESTDGHDLQSFMGLTKSIEMQYGSRLCRYALLTEDSGEKHFVLLIHHAIFDGWSLNIILSTLYQLYQGIPVPTLRPYSSFIHYQRGLDVVKAEEYWKAQLDGIQPAPFPRTNRDTDPKPVSRIVRTTVPFTKSMDRSFSKATILRAAWAIVLGRYCETDDVCFGTSISGRQVPIVDIDEMIGTTVATVPARINLDRQRTISRFLREVQQQASGMVPYEQYGMQNISKISPEIQEACKFSSLLVIEPPRQVTPRGHESKALLLPPNPDLYEDEDAADGYFTYPLVLQAMPCKDRFELVFTFNPAVLPEPQLEVFSHHLEHVIQQLLAHEQGALLETISINNSWDLVKAVENNADDPEIINACIHQLFESQARRQPNAIAVDAWDGQLSYSQLNNASNRLAHYLIDFSGVRVRDFVAVCFEKSAWFFVSILAINKAGAAWVPLDPSQSIQHQQQIVRQAKTRLVLASPANEKMCKALVPDVIKVTAAFDQNLIDDFGPAPPAPICSVSPDHAAYVVFTSGSTETPKGFIMEHLSVCTGHTAVKKRLRLTPQVRILQFTPYAFGLCIGEIVAPLFSGSTLCVPSEDVNMSDLKEFIEDHNVNWAFLTPTAARTLKPEDVPGLELLLLTGEAISRDMFETWVDKLRLVTGWGSAETGVFSTLHEWEMAEESPQTIGRPVGGFCWIVDPQDPQNLAPIGCIGEIVIQGPTLLREYLADPAKTQASMVTSLPEWAPRRNNPRWNRFFKPGDLCYYNADGTIEFVGRKGSQIKVRDLRVELYDIEHHLRAAFKNARQVVVDVHKDETGTSLIGCICFSDEIRKSPAGTDLDAESILTPLTDHLKSQITAAVDYLNFALPGNMVPTIFLPCQFMPSIPSAKIDRGSLGCMIANLPRETLASHSFTDGEKRAPATPMEIQLQKIWSSILRIPIDSIGQTDSFLRLGGDSISATQMVHTAREEGISLTVGKVFEDPRLAHVAAAAALIADEPVEPIVPWKMVQASSRSSVLDEAAHQCEVDVRRIEDAFPCTPFQEGLIALAEKQPGSYMARFVFGLQEGLDLDRFRAAIRATVSKCANIRTRFIFSQSKTFQVVLDEEVSCHLIDKKKTSLSEITQLPVPKVGYGTPLSYYILIHDRDHTHFVWDIHHSIYDNESLSCVLDILQSTYAGQEVAFTPLPFNSYVDYTLSSNDGETRNFWLSQLEGVKTTKFPNVYVAPGDTNSDASFTRPLKVPKRKNLDVPMPSLLRGAWALVIARYLKVDDVVFGCKVSGRNAPIPGIQTILGPATATVPLRIRVNPTESMGNFLTRVQDQSKAMLPFQHTGMQNIAKLSEAAREACEFNNLLVIQPAESQSRSLLRLVKNGPAGKNYDVYPLVFHCLLEEKGGVTVTVDYNAQRLTSTEVQWIVNHFEHVLRQLATKETSKPISQFSFMSLRDLEQIHEWNMVKLPEPVQSCVQDLISRQASRTPGHKAIFSREGSLTYAELDHVSTQLSIHLSRLGVRGGMVVPVCLEKSMWTTAVQLAVMKTGAAFMPFDPSHRSSYWRTTVKEVGANVMLVSPSGVESCAGMAPQIIAISAPFMLKLLQSPHQAASQSSSPRNVAYVLFTSGSTGTPKGVVIEQSALCSSIMGHGRAYGLSSTSRVLQFSNYMFDGSIAEIFTPLVFGGTVCVPSETECLQDIAGFIKYAQINVAMLTPSFSKTLHPDNVPSLETLVLGGEALSKQNIETWYNRVKLINAYGPTEVCVDATSHVFTSSAELPSTIGRSQNSLFWITDPKDHHKLAPLGCEGELLVQGPTLARGYFNNREKTESSFIQRVKWLPTPLTGELPRFYKTGDLVRYTADGNIEYIGRTNSQVQIRGLRVETREIEYHVSDALPDAKQVAVDVFEGDEDLIIAAYICFRDTTSHHNDSATAGSDDMFLEPTSELERKIRTMVRQLNVSLPWHMIPTLFIPCSYLPYTISAKLDKKKLLDTTVALGQQQLAKYSLSRGEKRPPATPMESRLQQIWADILKIPIESIGRDDYFSQIGGDSINAIQVVHVVRNLGMTMGFSDIFDDSRLSEVARKVQGDEKKPYTTEHFGLLPSDQVDGIKFKIQDDCSLLSSDEIEDAYPCTSLQEGLMALAVKQPGSYVVKNVYRLPENVDTAQFRAAWDQTLKICSNLRTRIVTWEGVSIQAVIRQEPMWEITNGLDLHSVMSKFETTEMQYSSRLCRYALIADDNEDDDVDVDESYFVLVVHHAVCDDWSLKVVLSTLRKLYHGTSALTLKPYSNFINYTTQIDHTAAEAYWKAQMGAAQRTTFPKTDFTSNNKPVSRIMKTNIPFTKLADLPISMTTLLRAAWAIVLSKYCDTDDVCFGTSVSGRQAPIAGIDQMTGLVAATVPVRIRLNRQQTISNFLQTIQQQATEMVPYEHLGLRNISKLSPEIHEACDFSSLLMIQPAQQAIIDGTGDSILLPVDSDQYSDEEALQGYFTYPLVVQGLTHTDHVELRLIYNAALIPERRMQALSHHFKLATKQLQGQIHTQLGELSIASGWDMERALEYNPYEPEIIRACVHQLVETQVQRQPEALAIQAWDGEMTYSELDNAANRLACHLIKLSNVQTGDLVHVCFEKSIWFFVSILAINKAGAAWVPLDPSHPLQRQQQIVQQTQSRLALVSAAMSANCARLVADIVEVTAKLDEQLLADMGSPSAPICDVTPDHAAYVLFISGSSGTPEGLVMQHGALCTSQMAISGRLGITPEVRILQFASFVFDLCIGEIIAPLISGATLCVPSEDTRLSGLKEFINKTRVNWAFLTPSFARTLKPKDIPELKLLLLTGEAVGRDVFETWFGKLRLVTGWGPAETCVFSTLHEWNSKDESPQTVGQPVGGYCWIVDPEDPGQLSPIGCIGEAVIQGPTLLQEYLANSPRTEASIMTSLPEWAPQRTSPYWNRFFKSGDLCYYNHDGTIEFVSRKDTQDHIRGLRVELGEVEHYLREALQGVKQVVVDVHRGEAGTSLVAYYCFGNDTLNIANNGSDIHTDVIFLPFTDDLKAQITAAVGQLHVALPSYMVPTIFFPCRFMPSISSATPHRASLKRLIATLDRETLSKHSLVDSEKRAPETPMEIRIQEMWATILKMPAESIGRDDSFLRVGGDSITVIQFVTSAYEAGLAITVTDVFADPRLWAVAAKVDQDEGMIFNVKPFSLLSNSDLDAIKSSIRDQCELSSGHGIDDAYPCTGLQEDLMVLSAEEPRSCVAKYVYRLPDNIDVARFKAAWSRTTRLCSNLRTRVARHGGASFQAVIREDVLWELTEGLSLRSVMDNANAIDMQYGSRLCRYALVNDDRGQNHFVLVIHHAIFDDWSLKTILSTLSGLYHGQNTPALQPYSSFINYATQLDDGIASEYWIKQLDGAQRSMFPKTAVSTDSKAARQIVKSTIPFRMTDKSITRETVLRAAWAIVLAQYCNAEDVCFGTSVSGRHAPVLGIDRIVGPVVSTVPVRMRLDRQQTVASFLQDVQQQAADIVAYEQFGLSRISSLSQDAKEVCQFSSMLVIQSAHHLAAGKDLSVSNLLLSAGPKAYRDKEATHRYSHYPLVLQCFTYDDHVELNLIFNPDIIMGPQLQALSHHVEHTVQQLLSNGDTPLGMMSIASDWDVKRALSYNLEDPRIIRLSVHSLVETQAQLRPETPAIQAWDGELTYSQLNSASNRLSRYLIDAARVRVGDLVHVCFDKSVWFFVAMLAINKAGAAWVPLDPCDPIKRQKQIIQQTRARLALVSPSNATKFKDLVKRVIEVTSALDQRLRKSMGVDARAPMRHVSPDQPAYVLFTSSSTGTPTGLVMQHGAVCTSQTAIGKRLELKPHVRILQFSSFVTDLCIGEIIAPLISGATICVPSEDTRMSCIKEFINDMNVNWAFLTPSFACTLKPEDVPGLELLLLTGEAISEDVFNTWFGKLRLVTGWGPAETCVFSTLHEWNSAEESPHTIGRPVGCFCWIVNPEDPQKLAPVGCLGELVIHGPTLLRDYLANPAKTASSTMTSLPEWVPHRQMPQWNRFFKSGDLCYYNPDGTIEFVRRKDAQAHIRGLRIELSEIEHHLRVALRGVRQIVVDVFKGDAGTNLVAYYCFSDDTCSSSSSVEETIFTPLTADLKSKITAALVQLRAVLPSYMVPTTFISCRVMPTITPTKIDRGILKRLTASLGQQVLAEYSLVNSEKRAPESQMETRLQEMWAPILRLPVESIGRDDSFLGLGGDSISAIQFVMAAREAGLVITARDILADPRLSAVAEKVNATKDVMSYKAEPFSLLPSNELDAIKATITDKCQLSSEQSIDDAYPCTSLQQGLMALAVKQPGSHIAKYVYQLPHHVDLSRVQTAWNRTVELCSALRTRIVVHGNTPIQAIIREAPAWEWNNLDLNAIMTAVKTTEMTLGSRLCNYALVSGQNGKNHFVLILHHAIFDAWSLNVVFSTFYREYQEQSGPVCESYSAFISYTTQIDQSGAEEYWKAQLDGAKRASFPRADLATTHDRVSHSMRRKITFPKSTNTSATKATILRAAWAIVLARYSDLDDVCFGVTISGRHAPVAGIDTMVGPTAATVPVRVRLNKQQAVSSLLHDMQQQASGMIPFEHYGLRNISKLSSEAAEACDFSSLMIIQPAQHLATRNDGDDTNAILMPVSDGIYKEHGAMEGYFTYPLVLQFLTHDNHVDLSLIYNSTIISKPQLRALSRHFDHVVQQLLVKYDAPLDRVSISGDWDLQQSIEWNSADAKPVNACVHDLISERAILAPDHGAIVSSDGNLTYAKLDHISTLLAIHLSQFGVGVGTVVPFCFEKSIWAVIAMLAIMKVGGVFVPIEPSHPANYRQAIIQETNARFMIVSPSTKASHENMVESIIELSSSVIVSLSKSLDDSYAFAKPTALDMAYIFFTSGSTGKPKSFQVDHSALSTTTVGHGRAYHLDNKSRVLQFSSYTFDVSLSEILETLTFGGTVCIPSDAERLQNIPGFIKRTKVNTAMLTSTFLRTLSPTDLPSLKLLIFVGEAPAKDVLDTWHGHVTVANAYGQSETSVFCASHIYQSVHEPAATIGRGFGGAFWIVEPDNHQRLAPIGCSGELVVQRQMARGYLDDEESAAASFIKSVDWLRSPSAKDTRKFFKTGDLVRYRFDGTVEYLGRRDTQVKIRGYRIEPGEIEYKIKRVLPKVSYAVVDVISHNSHETLVAFISFGDDYTKRKSNDEYTKPSTLLLPIDGPLRESFSKVVNKLKQTLPNYMVPDIFLPFDHTPFNDSMKLDRAKLHELAEAMTVEDLLKYQASQPTVFRNASTTLEIRLRAIFSQVLTVPEASISVDENFYHLGGDSIRLVTLAKFIHAEHGVALGMEQLNDKNLTVSGLAEFIESRRRGRATHRGVTTPSITTPSTTTPSINTPSIASQEFIRRDLMAELSSGVQKAWSGPTNELLAQPISTFPKRSTVFLTGATGYLGMAILRQLFRLENVATIIALVRAKSPQHGLQRLRRAARLARWWDNIDTKLEVWTGDLSLPHLGLNGSQWERLYGVSSSGNVNAIIHNGAVVHWNADIDKLRGPNVNSTIDLIKAAASSPAHAKFVYISGGDRSGIELDVKIAAENLSTSTGYVQTKFLSERIVHAVSTRLPDSQNRISTVKPGSIIGTVERGVANTDDFLWRVVSAAARVGAYPQEPASHWLHIADIDTVAAAVVGQLTKPDNFTPFVSIAERLPVGRFWDNVNAELEKPCVALPWDEWIPKALENMEQLGDTHPLWPVQHFLGSLGSPLPTETALDLKKLTHLQLAIRSNVRYLATVGYVPSALGDAGLVKEEQRFGRSTLV